MNSQDYLDFEKCFHSLCSERTETYAHKACGKRCLSDQDEGSTRIANCSSCIQEVAFSIHTAKGGDPLSQPEITFRHGACNAAVFQNKYNLGDAGFLVKTVSFQGSYQDKEGEW